MELIEIDWDSLRMLGNTTFLVAHSNDPLILEQFRLIEEDIEYWDTGTEEWRDTSGLTHYFKSHKIYLVN